MLRFAPAVFAVSDTYQLLLETTKPAVFSLVVGEEEYFEEINGIAPSLSRVHRISVPMQVLDTARAYTVRLTSVPERKNYYTRGEETEEHTFSFSPVPENARVFCVSDAHNRVASPTRAAEAFGEFDLAVLLGDIPEDASHTEAFSTVFELAAALTHGEKPCVFARGNHDMRGACAEEYARYTPTKDGNSFYTFRLGSLWGIVLDCGEDKDDGRVEYGPTIACRAFRRRQTRFLKDVISNKEAEYAAEGVKTRLVVCHVPFPLKQEEPFNIEEELYREWTDLLREELSPHLFLSGHTHKHEIVTDNARALSSLPCPIVITCEPREEEFIGCGICVGEAEISLTFTDSQTGAASTAALPK